MDSGELREQQLQDRAEQGFSSSSDVMNELKKAVTIVITSVFSRTVTHAFVIVAPFFQATVDVILICIDKATQSNRGLNQRLDRHLLDVFQHPNDHVAAAFNHAEDRRFLGGEGTSPSDSLESPSSPRAPFFATSSAWPLCPATM